MSQTISEIPGMSGEVLRLFESAGFVLAGDLLACAEEDVAVRLAAANESHGLVARMPSEAAVRAWISAARVLENLGPGDERVPLTADTMRKVRESAIMHARPVPGKELVEAGIPVGSVPIADFVGEPRRHRRTEQPPRDRRESKENRRRSERKLRPADAGEQPAAPPAKIETGSLVADDRNSKLPENQGGTRIYRLKSREEVRPEVPLEEAEPDFVPVPEAVDGEEEPPVAPRLPAAGDDQPKFRGIDDFTMARTGLERRNSGMTHKHPRRAVISAWSTVVAVLGGGLCGVSVIILSAYLVSAEKRFPIWMPALLAAAVVLGGQFFVFGTRARCRLCGQRLFVPKACLKHEKAHRSFLGSGFATAVNVISKGSWRCMFCGTKQKLK